MNGKVSMQAFLFGGNIYTHWAMVGSDGRTGGGSGGRRRRSTEEIQVREVAWSPRGQRGKINPMGRGENKEMGAGWCQEHLLHLGTPPAYSHASITSSICNIHPPLLYLLTCSLLVF